VLQKLPEERDYLSNVAGHAAIQKVEQLIQLVQLHFLSSLPQLAPYHLSKFLQHNLSNGILLEKLIQIIRRTLPTAEVINP